MKIRKVSKMQEKEVAEKFSGGTTIASGAMWFQKGDFRNSHVLGECKTTSKEYFSVTSTIWEKIENEALKDDARIPILVLDMLYKSNSYRYIIFKEKYFEGDFSYILSDDKIKQKSKRISIGEMNEIYPIDALKFSIWGRKENILCCMPINTFFDLFREVVV